MKISPRSALLPLFALLVVGCGGDGDDDNGSLASRFRGSYTGTFNSANGQSGSFEVQVAADGTLNATIYGLGPTGAQGTVTGGVNSSGVVNGTVVYQNPNQNANVNGSFQRDTNGRITGTLNLVNQSGTITINIDVTPGS